MISDALIWMVGYAKSSLFRSITFFLYFPNQAWDKTLFLSQ